jgi:hypothetical protein
LQKGAASARRLPRVPMRKTGLKVMLHLYSLQALEKGGSAVQLR